MSINSEFEYVSRLVSQGLDLLLSQAKDFASADPVRAYGLLEAAGHIWKCWSWAIRDAGPELLRVAEGRSTYSWSGEPLDVGSGHDFAMLLFGIAFTATASRPLPAEDSADREKMARDSLDACEDVFLVNLTHVGVQVERERERVLHLEELGFVLAERRVEPEPEEEECCQTWGAGFAELKPQIKRLLRFMLGKDSVAIDEVRQRVWEKDPCEVSSSMMATALSRCNDFLGRVKYEMKLSQDGGQRVFWV